MNGTRTILDQLEDAFLRFGPVGGALIGAPLVAGLLKDVSSAFLGFTIGGAAGAGLVYALMWAFFRAVNPRRDRSKRTVPGCTSSRLSDLHEPETVTRSEDRLSAIDWVLSILITSIAIIPIALFRIVRGQSMSGLQMIGISLVADVVKTILLLAVLSPSHRPPTTQTTSPAATQVAKPAAAEKRVPRRGFAGRPKKPVATFVVDEKVDSVTFLAENELLSTGVAGQKVWKMGQPEPARFFSLEAWRKGPYAFSQRGVVCAVANSSEKRLEIWDLASNQLLGASKVLPDVPRTLCFAPDDKRVVGGTGSMVWVFDGATGELIGEATAKEYKGGTNNGLTLTPDGATAAVISKFGTDLVNLADWKVSHYSNLPTNATFITGALFPAIGRAVLVYSGHVEIWDYQSQKKVEAFSWRLQTLDGTRYTNAPLPKSERVACFPLEKGLVFWDIAENREVAYWTSAEPRMASGGFAISRDGSRFATIDRKEIPNRIHLWDVAK